MLSSNNALNFKDVIPEQNFKCDNNYFPKFFDILCIGIIVKIGNH